jgi:hypothetical protein
MELNEPHNGYIMAESALRIMDPMLRDLVDPAIREEDISPGYRCALTETACMCYCNAALCIEAEQGKRGAPQITKYLEKGLQLAVTMLADGHPLIELLDDCSVDAGKKYGRQRLIADMALFTFEREETARKKKLMNDLSYGAPMNMSLPDLVAVTRHMEKHPGSTFTGGVQPIREIIDKPPPSPKRKSKDRNKQSQAASSQQKPSNPFLFFEDNELVQQEKRKWLYPNPEYVAHRVVDFKFKKKIMKQFQDMKTNDELYDMALFHQSFARVLTAVKAKKAKEEQFRRDALKGLHKLKTGAGHERLLEVIGDADEAAADVFGDVAKKALAMGAAMQKMGKRAEEAKDVVKDDEHKKKKKQQGGKGGTVSNREYIEVLQNKLKQSTVRVAVCGGPDSVDYLKTVEEEAERERERDRAFQRELERHRELEMKLERENAEAEEHAKAKKEVAGLLSELVDDAEHADGVDHH